MHVRVQLLLWEPFCEVSTACADLSVCSRQPLIACGVQVDCACVWWWFGHHKILQHWGSGVTCPSLQFVDRTMHQLPLSTTLIRDAHPGVRCSTSQLSARWRAARRGQKLGRGDGKVVRGGDKYKQSLPPAQCAGMNREDWSSTPCFFLRALQLSLLEHRTYCK